MPKKILRQVEIPTAIDEIEDSLRVSVSNPLNCPLTVKLSTSKKEMNDSLAQYFPLVISSFKDTSLSIYSKFSKKNLDPTLQIQFGNYRDSIRLDKLTLPFPKGKKYEIIQGYNGSFSHHDTYSKYAIDFNLVENDTICAAAHGYVVGVIKDYKYGGGNKKWRDYANYITLYHPKMNVFTQYVHLVHQGSFVAIGDTILEGQAIGLAGKTGFSNGEHLHFNVLGLLGSEMSSLPVSFKEGYQGQNLKKGNWVKK